MTAPLSLSAPGSVSRDVDVGTVVAAQRGERWAWRVVVGVHQRRVHALVWRMLASGGRRHLVEDVVQDAFLRVFSALPRFVPDGTARLSTWILSIATRAAIDELRRRRPPQAPLEVVANEVHGGERPDVRSEHASTGRAIARAVGMQSPEVRAAFVLRAYHDLDYAQIAQALDVGMGTVKSRLWRARTALAQHLTEVR
ncbi:MAG: sigma-70 family RNA polymerase sigma factor [Deltaproteobacteria bacterium]|nr:sigma-70 family RNA polymerase sigma factor [Deltaproteobacteria bacterium]